MIRRLENTKNGFKLFEDSNSEELKDIFREYRKVSCLIMNKKTAKNRFRTALLGNNIVTINNSVPDDCFYMNRLG